MIQSRRAGVLLGCCLTGISASALEVDVGERRIEFPLPEGLVELTSDMQPYYQTINAYVAPGNLRYFTLLPAADAEALLGGQQIELRRYINVETAQAIKDKSVSTAEFSELRATYLAQNTEMYAGLEEKLPDLLRGGNDAVSRELDVDVVVELGGFIPQPVHANTDETIANSMFMTVNTSVDGVEASPVVLAATTLLLHVSDKVVFLYVYGAQADLEWTRSTAAAWAGAILAANPLSGAEQTAVDQPGRLGKILVSALLGAVLAGGAALLTVLFRRRREAP